MRRSPLLLLTALFTASLFAAGHDLSTSPPAGHQIQPVVTGNGSGFTAAWIEHALSQYRVVSSVVNANGEPVEGGAAAVDQPAVSSIAIAHSPSDALVVWVADGNVYAERRSPSGKPIITLVLTPARVYPSAVAVAWNGNRYFVVWCTGSQLVGAFVGSEGPSTAPHPFFTQPEPLSRLATAPDVTWDGRQFIVVFGEQPYYLCNILCPVPNTDRIRVMRVSADGDAIDTAPALITGSHLRAHVASSGAESLIALDSFGEVSTIVAHTEGGLTLDAETLVFRWFSDVASTVVWDGATFRVGWRYAGADASWIGAAKVTRSGQPFDHRVTAVGAIPVWWGQPSMAVNEAGATAFAVSEMAPPSSFARARLYLASELAPMPPPPAAPRNVISYFGGSAARIDWQSDDSAAGFVIDSWSPYYLTWSSYGTVIPGTARSTTVSASIGTLLRVRAFGPGGVSEGTITSIGSMPRRRSSL